MISALGEAEGDSAAVLPEASGVCVCALEPVLLQAANNIVKETARHAMPAADCLFIIGHLSFDRFRGFIQTIWIAADASSCAGRHRGACQRAS